MRRLRARANCLNDPYDSVIQQYYGKTVRVMTHVIQPFHPLVLALAGWIDCHQQAVIDYLIEESRVLKNQLEGQRRQFTDVERRRLS